MRGIKDNKEMWKKAIILLPLGIVMVTIFSAPALAQNSYVRLTVDGSMSVVQKNNGEAIRIVATTDYSSPYLLVITENGVLFNTCNPPTCQVSNSGSNVTRVITAKVIDPKITEPNDPYRYAVQLSNSVTVKWGNGGQIENPSALTMQLPGPGKTEQLPDPGKTEQPPGPGRTAQPPIPGKTPYETPYVTGTKAPGFDISEAIVVLALLIIGIIITRIKYKQ